MAIDEIKGVQLPGSTEETYAYGIDYRGLEIDMSVLPANMVGDNGSHASATHDQGGVYTSDATPLFNDVPSGHPDGQTRIDQMRGVVGGHPANETLSNEQMYGSQSPLPMGTLPETANPELTD